MRHCKGIVMCCRAVNAGGPLSGQLEAGDNIWMLNQCPVTSSRSWLDCLATSNFHDSADHSRSPRSAALNASCLHHDRNSAQVSSHRSTPCCQSLHLASSVCTASSAWMITEVECRYAWLALNITNKWLVIMWYQHCFYTEMHTLYPGSCTLGSRV